VPSSQASAPAKAKLALRLPKTGKFAAALRMALDAEDANLTARRTADAAAVERRWQ